MPEQDHTAPVEPPVVEAGGAAAVPPPRHAEQSAHRQAPPREARAAAKRQAKLEQLERSRLRKAERAARGPGAWRTWVLPVLKLAVGAAIAIALVKLAFFPDVEAVSADDGLVPGAAFEEPLATVERGSVENAVSIEGMIVPVEAVPVRSTHAGTVARVSAADGAQVAEGDVLYTVRVETQGAPAADGTVPPPTARVHSIVAPAAGTLTGFAVLVGQSVDVAGETGAVQPPEHVVRASLGAAEQYRLTTQPESATVTIDGGPAPFECGAVAIAQPVGEQITTGASATLTCAVPGDVRVFVGLAAKVELSAGSASDVLLLPTTAVLGSAETGIAYRPGADGAPEEVPVELGLSDGRMVEVRAGLSEGDAVLQFVPGAADPCADPMTADPMLCGF